MLFLDNSWKTAFM